jgi:TetR/AcrR family transcriptional repressor of nem operon
MAGSTGSSSPRKPWRPRPPRSRSTSAREELADYYLSAAHRDNPGDGCPVSAMCGEVAHEDVGSGLRSVYLGGVREFVDALAGFADDPADRAERIATLCTLVGGLVLARATAGDPVSDEILAAAKNHVTG